MDEPSSITCDYLIIGAGASGCAFADALLSRGKEQGNRYKLVIVDERDQPGGHWNDAYKFARLHHPSRHYGVGSLELEKPVPTGHELHRASPNELLAYYQDWMDKVVREQGVVYFPMSSIRSGHKIVSLLDPKQEVQVQVQRKLVDTGFMRIQPPVSRAPPFEIAMGAVVVPPNHLSSISVASPASKFVIIGAGRTSIDVVLWLLSRKVPPERLHWVIARDHWLMCREAIIGDVWEKTNDNHMRACLTSHNLYHLGELCALNELLCRVDPRQMPQSMHGACVSQAELAELRRVTNVVRMGRVRAVTATQLVLERGVYVVGEGALHVDCTSSWIQAAPEPVPIFSEDRIVVQPVGEVLVGPGEFSLPLSAAFIGFIEAITENKTHSLKNSLITPVRWPDTLADWVTCHVITARNVSLWKDRRVSSWLCGDRLSCWSDMSVQATRSIFAKEKVDLLPRMALCLEKHLAKDKSKEESKASASREEVQRSKAGAVSGGTPPTP